MLVFRSLAAAAALALTATFALAQATAPAVKPPVTAPPAAAAVPAKPPVAAPTPAAAPAAIAKKVNLNTATAAELDTLPDVGAARLKVIMDERAKSKYKDWADFEKRMAGTSVNAGVLGKIKDKVSF